MNRPTAVLFLCAMAVLTCMPVVAHADNYSDFYSGDFAVYGGVSYYPGWGTASADPVYNSGALNFDFRFNGNVTNFQETPYCGLGCLQYYTADINSGTVQFSGVDESGQNPSYNFTGIIQPGGTLSGEIICDNQGCAWQNQIDLTFQSTSGMNGWQSSGSLSYTDGNDGWGAAASGI